MALNIVKMAVADPSHQRKPLAIVLDVDETVIDNTKLMGESIANGNGRFDAHKEDFGTTFVVFPNPAYRSWVSALAKGYQNLSPEEQKQVNNQYLQQ